MADPWTSHASVSLGGPGRPGHPGRGVRLHDLRSRRRRVARCRPRGSSSATPDSCPAGPSGSTASPPRPWPAPSPTPTRPPSWPGPGPDRGGPIPTSWSSGAATSGGACARTWWSATSARSRPTARSSWSYGADFADLFAVKEARVTGARRAGRRSTATVSLVFSHKNGAHRRSLRISFSQPAVLDGNLARWEVIIAVQGVVDAVRAVHLRHRRRRDRAPLAVRRSRSSGPSRPSAWRPGGAACRSLDTDYEGLRAVVARSAEDLGRPADLRPRLSGADGRGRRAPRGS